jgi:DNA-3-methyladenine glycosylase II
MKKAVDRLISADPRLAAIIRRVGRYSIQYRDPNFQTLVRAIVYQQLSGKAANTIFERLTEAARTDLLTPEAILQLRPARMRALGLSQQKTKYIRDLARMTRDGTVDFERCATLDDASVIEHLTQVKGVGVWTVHMFLLFALRRTDVLPTGDLGVRVAMQRAYELAALPSPAEMQRIAAPWRPYRSVAVWYLWRSLENQAAM